ncbi:MAG: hypothetical protein HEEMFOPI_01684 [Holosporales bacterium]
MKMKDIPQCRIDDLNQGIVETATLIEALSIDLHVLMKNNFPHIKDQDLLPLLGNKDGITKRMALAGSILLNTLSIPDTQALISHKSDTIRGIACYALAQETSFSLAQLLDYIKPFAADPHFGVREWAWLCVRPRIALEIDLALPLLYDWALDPCVNVRRFASEVTRPRGVWCAHISVLKESPQKGLPILNALKNDPELYVQNSVGNWLNDAAKTQPQWVQRVIADWAEHTENVHKRIVKLALRNLFKK